MHHLTLTLNPLIPSNVKFPPNQNPNPNFPNSSKPNSIINCRRIEVSVLNNSLESINWSNNGSFRSGIDRLSSKLGFNKDIDIATLGNLCVDIVLNVPNLPPDDRIERKAYMDRLSSSPPDKKYWEAGGNSNTAIAAARLGLRCTAIGHVGDEIYGHFLLDVLHDEGIGFVKMSDVPDATKNGSSASETLICWVLVDSLQRHGFCSVADFNEDPAFSWMSDLTDDAKLAIKRSKILVVNGYGFDELPPSLMLSALKYAEEVGTSVFFDPGPRGKSLSTGTPEEQMALSEFLKMSDVLLLTSDEAESLTGKANPVLAGKELLKRGFRTKWVIIKMGSKGSILITLSGTSCAPSFKVNIVDTVGCGDSFVAAVAFGFVEELPMVHTLTIANAVGAATAMGCGAGRNVATFEKAMELVKGGELNEDEKFWSEFLKESTDFEEITVLSKKGGDRIGSGLSCVPYERVVPELTSKFESTTLEVPSC